MTQQSTLVLFYGPTRTASTSLFYSHPTSSPDFSTTYSSETYYHYNNILHNTSYLHKQYLNHFSDPDKPILFDYEPLLFHLNASDDLISSYFNSVSYYFCRVLIVVTAREVQSLLRSVFQYSNSMQDYLSIDAPSILSDDLRVSLTFFLDYVRVVRSLKALSSSIDVRIVPFSDLLNDPNGVVSSLLTSSNKITTQTFYRVPLCHHNASSSTSSLLQHLSPLSSHIPSSIKRSRRFELTIKLFSRLMLSKHSDKSHLSEFMVFNLALILCPFTYSLSEAELVEHLQSI
jgi:hypothetical protein